MKKKFLSIALSACMILPCTFLLNACDEKCEHNDLSLQEIPTLTETGLFICWDCMKKTELPVLNETDYAADVTNPDYKIYTYTVNEQSFKFCASNFIVSPLDVNSVLISGYTGNSTNVVIPETYLSYSSGPCQERAIVGVTGQFERGDAFKNNTTITSVTFNSNPTTIGRHAFNGCTNLKEIIFNSSDVTVEFDAFKDCVNLENVFYKGTQEQWKNLSIDKQNNEHLINATKYYYSETQPTGVDYLNDNKTWHFDDNNHAVLWAVNFTNYVDDKSFAYSHSEVKLSDEYWAMLKEAQAQNVLDVLFDNDATQIEMVTSSATKTEYETKFAAWYGTTTGSQAVVSFTDGKASTALSGVSVQVDYIEVNGEIYNTSKKEKIFTFDSANNTVYEELATEYYTVRHVYAIVE